ncbi:hypothetical protein VIGAN_07153900 [Vigna angularis var. angularis]|uniref:Uncharacterized protein n=1 Tax=Vigna angularis var. angularis TaxID=157739 RepID=A0A0S3SIP2_PHAAN|nr:hypothetical protein VIGAN_07153900 [Vigna angularis var. angularis]
MVKDVVRRWRSKRSWQVLGLRFYYSVMALYDLGSGIFPCGHDGVTCLAWLGASYVAIGCVDGRVRLWDSLSGECVKTLKGHADVIQSLSVSANRDYLVSASLDGTSCAFKNYNSYWDIRARTNRPRRYTSVKDIALPKSPPKKQEEEKVYYETDTSNGDR